MARRPNAPSRFWNSLKRHSTTSISACSSVGSPSMCAEETSFRLSHELGVLSFKDGDYGTGRLLRERSLRLGGPGRDDQHRAAGDADQAVRDAAEKRRLEPPAPTRADDDQLG